jgi:hypothetical protein
MELNPFSRLAFGPPPNCLRLKTRVTYSPPRLATSEWLVLTRRESHPLYDTTYARPHTCLVSSTSSTKKCINPSWTNAPVSEINLYFTLLTIMRDHTSIYKETAKSKDPRDSLESFFYKNRNIPFRMINAIVDAISQFTPLL